GNAAHEFVSFAAPSRMLDIIPDYPSHPSEVHTGDVRFLSDVRNFLYLINPWQFETKASFLDALAGTDYDALILDLEFDGAPLSAEEVGMLKVKANAGTRLLLCYVSIGEAENYRGYGDPAWFATPPEWLLEENPEWPCNYPVQYWHPEWREIVFGMMDAVLSAGFDGVYLDRIDVYEEFEK
ncbi:MAG: endo alpha-1,4 polygalactosaminidase, partial [Candidatus Bipolaricaulota bacterium]